MDAFGVYIHWPYCAAKCPYCDFNSHAARGIGEARYLSAVLRELAFYAELAPGRTVSSIFIGGGTPSLMAPATVGRILEAVAAHWSVAPGAEITIEANPSSVEAGRFEGYRAGGVNRVSLGVQALSDGQLRALGRIHTADEARAALAVAKRHFERVTFDMIYARPGQTLADWRTELTEALTLAAGHISLYQLTIEAGTPFYRLAEAGRLCVPEGDAAAELYAVTQELCEVAGLPAYEISNHAAPGEESRHNLLYWRYGSYAGVGPGAHGRLAAGDGGARLALEGVRDPAEWVARVERCGHGLAVREALTPLEEAQEILLMGLRLHEGLALGGPDGMEVRTGYRVGDAALRLLAAEGLLVERDARIAATSGGRLVLNAVIAALAEALEG